MNDKVHTLHLTTDLSLMNKISTLDRFDVKWSTFEKREGRQVLKELRSVATVESTGASTRIEGARMPDQEVERFIEELDTEKLQERDEQEVLGYYETLETILDSYPDIEISQADIRNLHDILLKHSDRDHWHKGAYKQVSNTVEATSQGGHRSTLFRTSDPGIETREAMENLIAWYHRDHETPSILKTAVFVYDFLSIHPFQDGNGRLSRLLTTLLLMKQGYTWIQYVSFEHEIENRKREYYQVLKTCQRHRPGENIDPWVGFFLSCLENLQAKLEQKVERQKREVNLTPREKAIYHFIDHHPGVQAGVIADKLGFALPTVKRTLSEMVKARILARHGRGKGTHYTTEPMDTLQYDLMMKFSKDRMSHRFTLDHRRDAIHIKKIILVPLFPWQVPDDWGKELLHNGLEIHISIHSKDGKQWTIPYLIESFNSPRLYKPVFTFKHPIRIPEDVAKADMRDRAYPLSTEIALHSKKETPSFEVSLVYDWVA